MAKPARSPLIQVVALGWCAAVIGALILLHMFDIPLGQGSFQYRFSEWQGERLIRATPIVLIALLSIVAIARAQVLLGLLLVIALSAWVWWAPPDQIMQHSFNLRSPSHEGAFVIEAEHVHEHGESLRPYLRSFDQRIQKSSDEMMGTRVISNPPGMTIAFYWLFKFEPFPSLERIAREHNVNDEDLPLAARTMAASIFLTAIWMLSAIPIYFAARHFLPVRGAMLTTLVAWFNPSTINFVPGKDPAQLLFVGLMLFFWLKKRPLLFGITLAIASTFGLVFFWVAGAIVLASFWNERKIARDLLFAAIGFFAVALAVYLIVGWNMLATLLAVSHRYVQVQRELHLNRAIWFIIGVPIFLLFVSPGIVTCGAIWLRRRKMNFAARLAISTLAMMLLSYLAGITYELPRLWVVLLPLLSIGIVGATRLSRAKNPGKATTAVIFIAIVQLLFTAAQWSQLDVRESEFRLRTQRFFSVLSLPEWTHCTG